MIAWRDKRFVAGLGAIVAAGLLLRLLVLLLHLGTPVPVDHEVVARAGAVAGEEVRGVADAGDLIAQVDASQATTGPPLWPVVRTVATLGLGGDAGNQLVATLIGCVTIGLVGLIGFRLGGRRTGLLAAVVAAAYPGMWIYESAAMAESLLLAGVAGTILLAFHYFDQPTLLRAAALGGAAGLLTLVRTEQALVLVALVIPLIAIRSRDDRRRLLVQLATAGAATFLVIAPWWVANLARLDEPVPVSTGLGADVAAASCSLALEGGAMGTTDPECTFAFGRRAEGPTVATDAGALDAALRDQSLDRTLDDRQRLPLIMGTRMARITGVLGAGQTVEHFATWSHQPTPVIWLWLTSGIVLAIAAVRGAMSLKDHRIPLLPLLSFVGVAAASAAFLGGDLRFRAAAAVPLVVLAAVGLTSRDLRPPLQRRTGKVRPPAVAWRATMPDAFWDDLVDRLAAMDDDEPITPTIAKVPTSSGASASARVPTPPAPPPPASRRLPPPPAPTHRGDPVIDLRDAPAPPPPVERRPSTRARGGAIVTSALRPSRTASPSAGANGTTTRAANGTTTRPANGAASAAVDERPPPPRGYEGLPEPPRAGDPDPRRLPTRHHGSHRPR